MKSFIAALTCAQLLLVPFASAKEAARKVANFSDEQKDKFAQIDKDLRKGYASAASRNFEFFDRKGQKLAYESLAGQDEVAVRGPEGVSIALKKKFDGKASTFKYFIEARYGDKTVHKTLAVDLSGKTDADAQFATLNESLAQLGRELAPKTASFGFLLVRDANAGEGVGAGIVAGVAAVVMLYVAKEIFYVVNDAPSVKQVLAVNAVVLPLVGFITYKIYGLLSPEGA